MKSSGRGKTLLALAAVLVALWGSIDHSHSDFELVVAPRGDGAALETWWLGRDGDLHPGLGNAVLVDARRHLYLTAAHMRENAVLMTIVAENGSGTARFPRQWADTGADVAIIQMVHARYCPAQQTAPLSAQVLTAGTLLEVRGYSYYRDAKRGTTRRYGSAFTNTFTVVSPRTDDGVDQETCALRDMIREKAIVGFPLTTEEQAYIFPEYIYVVGSGIGHGLVPGMSGSPVFDAEHHIVGVVSFYILSDPSGNHGFFAPARLALPLLARAQADVDRGVRFDDDP